MSTVSVKDRLPQYRCHKTVRAAPIIAILRDTVEVVLDTGRGTETLWLGMPWFNRHDPKVGGYIVYYDDGYTSYSPKAAFERGYSLADEVNAEAGAPA